MFGLWFSIIGLIFGVICSLKAREKNRATQEWFILGFIFSVIALAVIYILPSKGLEVVQDSILDPDDDLSYSELIY
jgi:hypothetical protein